MKSFSLIAVASLLALSACQSVPVDSNGGIPNEYVSQLDQASGFYKGTLELHSSLNDFPQELNKDFQVEVSRTGNRPFIRFGSDILGQNCGSSVGKLTSLQVGGPWDVYATFEFDPGQCADQTDSREVYLYLKRNGEGLVDLHKRTIPAMGRRDADDIDYQADLKKI